MADHKNCLRFGFKHSGNNCLSDITQVVYLAHMYTLALTLTLTLALTLTPYWYTLALTRTLKRFEVLETLIEMQKHKLGTR